MATVIHEHTKLGKLELVADADSMTQWQVEQYLDAYQALDGKFDSNGRLVRAAVTAGWVLVPALKVEDVGSKSSRWVAWAGKIIDRLYGEATTPDPKVSAPPPATPGV